VFDTNFRARGWPDPKIARQAFGAAFEAADIVLASSEDLLALYPDEEPGRSDGADFPARKWCCGLPSQSAFCVLPAPRAR